jgi:hypothetical protein
VVTVPKPAGRLAPVYHYGAGVHPTRTAWLVRITWQDGTESMCCESTHGHRTQDTAVQCSYRAARRRNKKSGGHDGNA